LFVWLHLQPGQFLWTSSQLPGVTPQKIVLLKFLPDYLIHM
jgi:hypothetical protein